MRWEELTEAETTMSEPMTCDTVSCTLPATWVANSGTIPLFFCDKHQVCVRARDDKEHQWGMPLRGREREGEGEVRVTDPKTGGQKGTKPEAYGLIPDEALDELARVYGVGAKKYAPYNWLKGYRWSLSVSALKRHLSQWCQGIDRDEETGCHHLIHVAWHCLTLFVFQRRGLGTDDRMTPYEGDKKL